MDGVVDIGHGVWIAPTEDGLGIYWSHVANEKCRPGKLRSAWFQCYFRPDPRSTGHQITAGSVAALAKLTVQGSLACPTKHGCPSHGTIENGRWKPA